MLGAVVALVVLVIIGFRADASQKEAIEDVPELVDNVIEWKDDVCKCLKLCVCLVFVCVLLYHCILFGLGCVLLYHCMLFVCHDITRLSFR